MIQPEILLLVAVAGGLFTLGLVCLIARSNLIKMVMGIEFCGKGVSLLFILGGYIMGDVTVSQSVVFTLIAIEAVVAGLALALGIMMKRVWNTFESEKINHLAQGGGK